MTSEQTDVTANLLDQTQNPTMLDAAAKRTSVFQEVYPILEPYVYAAIVKEHEDHKIRYEVIEPTLKPDEEKTLQEVKKILIDEIDVNLKDIEGYERAKNYLVHKTRETIKKYRIKIAEEAIDKLAYYVVRDFLGYGKIDPIMKDHMIEDISADGVNVPIYVWHRQYESLPTNIVFNEANELDSFIIRLAYLAGKNISLAQPILDATLPDGSRVQLTYGNEITRRGSTFTIRRFKTDPLTITDLIAFNTINAELAAYLWYIIENRSSVLVAGGIACGKTTMLNCLSMFIRPELKIVTVEDTQELNIAHENWIPSVARAGFKFEDQKAGTITLFDLLKTAMRQRPDYIIVGEVRGEEAYTLFQAMATGHLGMATLHAESVESAIRRLQSEPMNIPDALIAMTNVIMVMTRTEVNGRPARRVASVAELEPLENQNKNLQTEEVFRWNPNTDNFTFSGHSKLIRRSMLKMGLTESDIAKEFASRRTVLEWMVQQGIRRHTDVAKVIREYYANPARVFQRARVSLK